MVRSMSDPKPPQRRNPITNLFMATDEPMPSRLAITRHHTKRLVKDPIGQFLVVLAVGIVIASLAAAGIIKMSLAWVLLGLAWAVGVFGTFLLDHLWNVRHKHRATLAAVLAIIFGGIGWYEQEQQPPTIDESAKLFSSAPPVMMTADGKYYYVAELMNVGKMDVTGIAYMFGSMGLPHEASSDEEDMLMESLEDDLSRETGFGKKSLEGGGIPFPKNTPYYIHNPGRLLTQKQYDSIIGGQMFYYFGTAIMYMDEFSEKKNKVYFAENCFWYDAQLQRIVNCGGKHNFIRADKFPPKGLPARSQPTQ